MTKPVRCRFALCLPLLFVVSLTGARAQAQRPDTRPASEARLPGLSATTGLLRLPTAYLTRNGNATLFFADDRNTTGGLLLGLGQRLELGLSRGNTDASSSAGAVSAKFRLIAETLLTPAVSVGVLDAFRASPDGQSGYVVVSKSLIPYFVEALTGRRHLAFKVHAGYGGGRYRNRPFVGAEVWGDNRLGLLGEVVSGQSSIGARYSQAGIGVTLGWMQWERFGGSVCYTVPLR